MSGEQATMNNTTASATTRRRPGLLRLIAEDLDCVFQRDP